MLHDLELEAKLFDEYKQMNLGNSPFCLDCQHKINDLSKPSTIWGIGKNFQNSVDKVLFVGKNARGNPGKSFEDTNFLDCRDMGDDLWKKGWAYFAYVKNIAEKVFPESGINSIAYTNLIKCNNTWDDTKDTTNEIQKDNCINLLGVIKKEVETINPTKIIFLTSWYYDAYINSIFDKIDIKKDTKKQIGKKRMPWKDFVGEIDKNSIKVLRIGHPERMKKDDYVNEVSNWIISS